MHKMLNQVPFDILPTAIKNELKSRVPEDVLRSKNCIISVNHNSHSIEVTILNGK